MRWRTLLAPLSPIYWLATWAIGKSYDLGWRKSQTFGVPVICVGNITVGGTGKTPLTEHIIDLLGGGTTSKIAVVSRGYRRKSKGMVVATPECTAEQVGDEPCQMKHKYPAACVIACADRCQSIGKAEQELCADVVIMDDGMQHRRVRPSLTIMVCDYARPIWQDMPLPAGDLREPWSGRLRADVVVVNKCPSDLTAEQAAEIEAKMKLSPHQEVYFCSIGYGEYQPAPPSDVSNTPALAIAGIGRPEPFFAEVGRRHSRVTCRRFDDHHTFSESEAAEMRQLMQEQMGDESIVVTTEKDATRLPDMGNHTVYTLPIRLRFLFDTEKKFNQKIRDHVIHR